MAWKKYCNAQKIEKFSTLSDFMACIPKIVWKNCSYIDYTAVERNNQLFVLNATVNSFCALTDSSVYYSSNWFDFDTLAVAVFISCDRHTIGIFN